MILSVLASLALVSGLMVVRAKNPVHSVLFPILVFCDTSGLLLLLGLDFFAMIFLVVHIGAIVVSFLFVIPRQRVWKWAGVILKKALVYFFVLFLAPVLWDWGFTWLAPILVLFEEWQALLISPMERLPISVGSGGNAGPSNPRPFDLNEPYQGAGAGPASPDLEFRLGQPGVPAGNDLSPEQGPEAVPDPNGAALEVEKQNLKGSLKSLLQVGLQGSRPYFVWEQLFSFMAIDNEQDEDFLIDVQKKVDSIARNRNGRKWEKGEIDNFKTWFLAAKEKQERGEEIDWWGGI